MQTKKEHILLAKEESENDEQVRLAALYGG
jgi:hypothetical protein